jgi:hypothetical protein
MASIHDDVLDEALSYISTNAETLYICNADPGVTWANIASYGLGSKSSPAFGSLANGDVSGRKLPVSAITDGSVTSTDTASHWAITDDSATKILASGALSSSQAVTSGNTFTLTAFDIEIPDPA